MITVKMEKLTKLANATSIKTQPLKQGAIVSLGKLVEQTLKIDGVERTNSAGDPIDTSYFPGFVDGKMVRIPLSEIANRFFLKEGDAEPKSFLALGEGKNEVSLPPSFKVETVTPVEGADGKPLFALVHYDGYQEAIKKQNAGEPNAITTFRETATLKDGAQPMCDYVIAAL